MHKKTDKIDTSELSKFLQIKRFQLKSLSIYMKLLYISSLFLAK